MTARLPSVFWFYGLSGAGKTTLTQAVAQELKSRGIPCLILDGDEFRAGVSADLGFSPEDRTENIRRAATIAKLACQQGFMVLAAFITPTIALRRQARQLVSPCPFVEIFLDCDYATGAQRDVKGLYARATKGQLPHFTGRDAPFEAPATPDLRLDTRLLSLTQCQHQVLSMLHRE